MTFYAMNTKTKINPSKPEQAHRPYYDVTSGEQSLIVVKTQPYTGKPSVRVVSSYGAPGVKVGDGVGWIYDTGMGHRDGGSVVVIGLIHKDGSTEGEIPTKSVTLHVMK